VEKKIVCKSASLGSLPRTPRLPLTLCLSPAPLPPVPASQAFPFVSICPETDASSPTHQDAAPIAMPPPRLDRRRRPPPSPPPAASPKPKPPSNEPNPDSRGAIATINRWFHEGLLAIIAGFGRLSISLSSAPPSHPPGTPPSLSVLRIVDLFRDVFVEFFKIYQIIHPFKYFFPRNYPQSVNFRVFPSLFWICCSTKL
jgi:hypothetical protein